MRLQASPLLRELKRTKPDESLQTEFWVLVAEEEH